MTLTRTSTGRLYGLNDFSTPPFDVLADWDILAGTVAIEGGELSVAASGGVDNTGQLQTKAVYGPDQVLSARFKRDTSSQVSFYLRLRTSPTLDGYEVMFTSSQVGLWKFVAGAWSNIVTAAIVCDAASWHNVKILAIGSAIKIWYDSTLVIDATNADVTNAGWVRILDVHPTVNTAHSHFDNVSISSANTVTCSGLPDGWDLVVGTKTAAASGGVATVDLADLPLPAAALYVKNSADATKWTWGETWGGDVFALDQGRVVELYEAGGAYLKDLPATYVERSVDRQRQVRRTATIRLPLDCLVDVKVLGRMVRVYDGTRLVFWGYIDGPRASVSGDGRAEVEVLCRDKTKRLKAARFSQDTTFEDFSAKETPNLYSTASASSELGVGGEIQRYAVVYQRALQATVLGVVSDVTQDATETPATVLDPKQRIVQGADYSIDYSAPGLSQLALTVYIDMRVVENVSDIIVTTNGTLGTRYVSTDAVTWSAFAAGSFRFIKFTITKAAGPITCSAVIKSGASYPATAVGLDNHNSWRPTPDDMDRYITATLVSTVSVAGEAVGTGNGTNATFNLDWFPITASSDVVKVNGVTQTRGTAYTIDNTTGAITFLSGYIPAAGAAITADYSFPTQGWNVLYLRWGVNDLDRTTRYVYDLYRSADGSTWTLLAADCEATSSYLVEHVVALTTDRYIKIVVKRASGPVALRYLQAQYVSTTGVALSEVIQSIASAAGETLFRITPTRRWTKPVTFLAGTERWGAIEELALTIGWELYYSADGYLVFAPPDTDITDPAIPTYEAMFDLEAEWSDADIYNQVIGVYDAPTGALRSVQTDDNAFSPTSTVRLGTRTAPVQRFPLADTQQKLDAATLRYLQDVSRQRVRVSFTLEGVPDHEAGDVIYLKESLTGLSGYFTLESFSVSDDPNGDGYVFHASVVQEVV